MGLRGAAAAAAVELSDTLSRPKAEGEDPPRQSCCTCTSSSSDVTRARTAPLVQECAKGRSVSTTCCLRAMSSPTTLRALGPVRSARATSTHVHWMRAMPPGKWEGATRVRSWVRKVRRACAGLRLAKISVTTATPTVRTQLSVSLRIRSTKNWPRAACSCGGDTWNMAGANWALSSRSCRDFQMGGVELEHHTEMSTPWQCGGIASISARRFFKTAARTSQSGSNSSDCTACSTSCSANCGPSIRATSWHDAAIALLVLVSPVDLKVPCAVLSAAVHTRTPP
mmetsp:Transcript_6680/g.15373  ORF Transcript_6680/g.15373 Transcript_6680/m.15373 type:complete len:283 (+) Transcript_6680:80-928(+)